MNIIPRRKGYENSHWADHRAEMKDIPISIRVTRAEKKFIDQHKISPTELFRLAINLVKVGNKEEIKNRKINIVEKK